MALSKIQTGLVDTNAIGATELNLADNFAFTGTVSGAGKIIQVVQEVTATIHSNNSASSWTDITSATITPTSSSNKVLVQVVISYGGTSNSYAAGRLLRTIGGTSTALRVGSANYTENRFSDASFGLQMNASNDTFKVWNTAFNYLDSPSTTSATTYKTQCLADAGYASRSVYINYSVSNAGDGYNPPPWTTLTLTEIAG
jgi:hypothetical protein